MALILSCEDVASVLTMNDATDAVEGSFRDLAEDDSEMPPRQRSVYHNIAGCY